MSELRRCLGTRTGRDVRRVVRLAERLETLARGVERRLPHSALGRCLGAEDTGRLLRDLGALVYVCGVAASAIGNHLPLD